MRKTVIHVFAIKQLPIVGLAIAGCICPAVYSLIFVKSAFLLTDITIPKYDLQLMVQDEPSILWLYRIGFLILAVAYIVGGWASRHAQGRMVWVIIISSALLSSIMLLFLNPYDAADMFDYIMHGRMLAFYDANPYRDTASLFPLDPFYPHVGWVNSISPYGPFWLQISALTARLSGNSVIGNVLSFKMLVGLFYVASIVFIVLILRRQNPTRVLNGLWLFACNPLVLYETFGHGHNDITICACLLVSVWFMINHRHTLVIIALVTGALFKYVTLLVIPAALVISLVSLANRKERLRYMLVTGLATALLVFIAYQPFWFGWKTIDLSSRIYMYTTSLAAIIHTHLRDHIDLVSLSQTTSAIATVITISATLFFSWQASRDRNWMSYPRAALTILLFYLLVTCLWVQQWYVVWLIGMAALLPLVGLSFLTYMTSFAVITKALLSAPPLLWVRPLPAAQFRELWLTLEVMGLPWLVSLFLVARHFFRSTRKRQERSADNSLMPPD
ncbi:MAG: DUF2029 domain-containing protein [Anaerolineaceae bacterium]|nr:DUF2029 domain-containing protein [Anaerolineaceae bacterium]